MLTARIAIVVGLIAITSAAHRSFAAEGDAPKEKNLIADGSFEGRDAGAVPAAWGLYSNPAGAYKASIADAGKTGKRSVLLEGEGTFGVLPIHKMELPAKSRFALRGAVKIEGTADTKATIKFDLFNEKNDWIASVSAGDFTGDSKDWRNISVIDRFAEHPTAKSCSVALGLVGKGKAWFDDVELVAIDAKDLPDNLLVNGSFENVLGDKPGNLWLGTAEGGKVTAKSSTENPKDGKHTLHLTGNAEWAVATLERAKIDRKKTYTVTGFVRVKSGAGQIKIDYFENDQWLGSTFGTDVTDNEWQQQEVSAELDMYPAATHITATCVGTGEFEAWFDRVVLTAK